MLGDFGLKNPTLKIFYLAKGQIFLAWVKLTLMHQYQTKSLTFQAHSSGQAWSSPSKHAWNGVYIKEGLPCDRDLYNENRQSPFMCFRMTLLHFTSFMFFLYRPHHEGAKVFDDISNEVDKIILNHPSTLMCNMSNGSHNQETLTPKVMNVTTFLTYTNCRFTYSCSRSKRSFCFSPLLVSCLNPRSLQRYCFTTIWKHWPLRHFGNCKSRTEIF